jgi:ferredoxin
VRRGRVGHGVRVDKDVCVSSGRCVADAPDGFRFDDDEIAEPTEAAPGLAADLLRAIADGCPSGAIRLAAAPPPDDRD